MFRVIKYLYLDEIKTQKFLHLSVGFEPATSCVPYKSIRCEIQLGTPVSAPANTTVNKTDEKTLALCV